MNSDQPRAQWLFFFGNGQADGGQETKHLVGGKGASLADMTRAGLDVPPGFTISAECCRQYFEAGRTWPEGLRLEVRQAMQRLEQETGRTFGQGDNPLLVAVRSGAAESMPGMMDTILNVGLNPDCVRAIGRRTGNPRTAWEAYRHVLVTFGETVGGLEARTLAAQVAETIQENGVTREEDLDATALEALCQRFQDAYQRHTGRSLPVDPYEMLFQAIETVFASWHNERAVTYREHHNIQGLLGTAVTVQMMCPSEVSGVLFTAHPVNPALQQMIIESSFGLGEAVVLGKVTPDRFVVSRLTGVIVERDIAEKHSIVQAVADKDAGSQGSRSASLTDAHVQELFRLGLRVEEYFQMPCDIEWGLAQGRFYLLQARAIKRVPAAVAEELAKVRQEEIARLRTLAAAGDTVWSRYNLAEILAEPTPMTWAIVCQFMSGRGGFGQMYRDLGFDPDPALDEVGIFDLVCGRPYCNLSREPKMQYRRLPFEHPFARLKKTPQLALYPVAEFNPARAGWRFWLMIPAIFFQLFRASLKLRAVARDFARRFREEIVPPFLEEVARAEKTNLQTLEAAALHGCLQYWIRRTLFDFARDSLKPTALAGLSMGNLERTLTRLSATPGQSNQAASLAKARDKVRQLVMGVRSDPDTDLPGAIRALARGQLDQQEFLRRFGHRGHQEMELANPRWAEVPATVERQIGASDALPVGATPPGQSMPSPFAEYRLPAAQRVLLERETATLHTYLALRETAKHHLLRGYALIRRLLMEIDRRHHLDGGIFFLTPEELPDLLAGKDLLPLIQERRRRRELLLKLDVPPVLFSDTLEVIGRPAEVQTAGSLQGIPLSAGVAEGLALVLLEPPPTPPSEQDYILVCPSTDPAWMPLFVKARGILMETGGMLSHGAIVAREFGLPAVAGLPDVHRRLHTGQRLRVDGSTGRVNLLE